MFQCIFLIENFLILNEISLKYIPYGLVDNMAALVQIMAWRRTGDRPLSEPMLVCFIDAYIRHSTSMSQSAVTSHNCSVFRWTCVAQFLYDLGNKLPSEVSKLYVTCIKLFYDAVLSSVVILRIFCRWQTVLFWWYALQHESQWENALTYWAKGRHFHKIFKIYFRVWKWRYFD